MKRFNPGGLVVTLGLLGCGGAVSAAPGACEFRQEVQPEVLVEPGAKDESRVTLLAVEPPAGKTATMNTVVKVDVEYHVAGFQPGKHLLSAQFLTLGSGTVSIVGERDRNFLAGATGRARLCVPLRGLYANPAMRWPLTFEIVLHEVHRRSSDIMAKSPTHSLDSRDTPAAALARQAATPSAEYQAALLHVFGYFEATAAFQEACSARFADLAPALAEKYARWIEPHAGLAAQVSKEQFELYRLLVPGSDRYAEMSHGAARASATRKYQDMPDFALRRDCDALLQGLGTARMDPEVRLSEQLSVLRDPKAKNPTDAT